MGIIVWDGLPLDFNAHCFGDFRDIVCEGFERCPHFIGKRAGAVVSARAIFEKRAKARTREEGDGIWGVAFEFQKLRVENFSRGVYCLSGVEIFFGLRLGRSGG